MKIFCCFFIAFILCLVPGVPAQISNTASNQSNPRLLLDVHINPVFDAKGEVKYDDEKDEEVKYHVSFELAIKNTGADQYQLSRTIHKLWTVVVYQKDSQKTLKWDWTGDESKITTLLPGQELHATADWDALNDAKSGVYTVTATFDDTGRQVTAEFTLPPLAMSANILLTGRLMGYYRLPDKQKFEFATGDPTCVPDEKAASPDARTFFDNFQYDPNDHQIRVGMGDNFAPNYFGRAFANPDGGRDPLETRTYGASKGVYYWDTVDSRWKPPDDLPTNLKNIDDVRNGRGTIPTDNVGCFLSYAHYDAIVPGMLDFHFGIERLRELARFLAGIKDNKFQPVQMLAANMTIRTSWLKDHDPVPDSAKPQLPFVTKYRQASNAQKGKGTCFPEADSSLEVTNIKDGGFVFPWMQFVRMEVKGCVDENPKLYLCKATERGPDDFLENNGSRFCNEAVELRLAGTKGKPDKREVVYQFVPTNFDFVDAYKNNSPSSNSLLKPGGNYAICAAAPKQKPDHLPYCVRFTVYTPFFQHPNWPQQIYPEWSQEGGNDNNEHHYINPSLYLLKNAEPKDVKIGLTPVVIFGIVDPKLLENIGADNYSWQTVSAKNSKPTDKWNKEYKTQVLIADPVTTLTELQQYFEQHYCFHHQGKRFHGIRVLLAQMQPEQARELAEHLPKSGRFDVVISAADNALATPSQIVQMKPAVLTNNEGADDAENLESTACLPEGTPKPIADNSKLLTPTSFIAVPARHDAAKTRWLQARKLHVESDGRTYWNYVVSGKPIPVTGIPSVGELASVEDRFWQRIYDRVCKRDENHACGPQKERDEKSDMAAIQQLVLSAMRDNVQADVALLEEKDFYPYGLKDYLAEHCQQPGDSPTGSSPKCSSKYEPPVDIQQILERIVWKGDFIQSLSVTGSVLKTILKKSDQFAEIEEAGYIPVDEKGRPLVKLGIRPDPNNTGEYLINGKPLDPNALYTVASSDFIALGDTGYPELAKPPVGDPDPPASPRVTVSTVSAIACREIKSHSSNPSDFCNEDIPGKDFPDRAANRKPDDARAVNTNVHKFYAWTFLRRPLGQRSDHSRNLPATTWPEAIQIAMQKRAEDDPDWKWSVDKLSIGFAGLTHTDTTETLSQKFGGVLISQVNANHFHSWDWDADSKITFYAPRVDWFAEGIVKYSSNFTAQLGAPRNENQLRNLLALDGGSYVHLLHDGKALPQFSLVLSGYFATQVGSVVTSLGLNAVPPATSGANLTFNQGRVLFLVGRPGLRWENRKSYIEAGLQGGSTLNAIRQFNILVAPGGATVPCALEASVSLTNCINAFNQNNPTAPVTGSSKVTILRSPQDRYGAYWKIRMVVPINPLISYKFEDRSDYFFLSSGDNSADTRFQHELVSTVKFNVMPNLSFEPTYTIFLYENKLDYNFLLQQQYSIKINYSFDLSNWHEKNRQLKYAKAGSQ